MTMDRNIPLQQNLANVDLAIILLEASSNRLVDLSPLVERMLCNCPCSFLSLSLSSRSPRATKVGLFRYLCKREMTFISISLDFPSWFSVSSRPLSTSASITRVSRSSRTASTVVFLCTSSRFLAPSACQSKRLGLP
jgi:hypothetical protein